MIGYLVSDNGLIHKVVSRAIGRGGESLEEWWTFCGTINGEVQRQLPEGKQCQKCFWA